MSRTVKECKTGQTKEEKKGKKKHKWQSDQVLLVYREMIFKGFCIQMFFLIYTNNHNDNNIRE